MSLIVCLLNYVFESKKSIMSLQVGSVNTPSLFWHLWYVTIHNKQNKDKSVNNEKRKMLFEKNVTNQNIQRGSYYVLTYKKYSKMFQKCFIDAQVDFLLSHGSLKLR